MNSVPLRVVEFWERFTDGFVWKRKIELQREVPCEWWCDDDPDDLVNLVEPTPGLGPPKRDA